MCREGLTIGALAKKTGCNMPTIRYYGEADLRRLTLIRRCRYLDFSAGQVRISANRMIERIMRD